MAFSQTEISSLQAGIASALTNGSLDNWQTKFLEDMGKRLGRDGVRAHLSPKQIQKLRQIIAPFTRQTQVGSGVIRKPSHWSPSRSGGRPRPRYQSKTSNRARRSRGIRTKDVKLILVLALGFIIAVAQFDSSGSRSPISEFVGSASGRFSITDGDTIKMNGESKGTRLVGFNTPETYKPLCQQELALGKKATQRLEELVRTASLVEVEKVACACLPGTQGTSECNYGRSCGVLRVDGRDVGPILVSEGLAVNFKCGRTTCPRTPRPWCN